MRFWKTAALLIALLGAAAVGSTIVPKVAAQTTTRITPPAADWSPMQVFGGGSSRIGVSVADVDAADGKTAGVKIESVEGGSPAEKAGLKSGDVVVEFDGERVRSVRQFTRLVSETPAGRQVPAAVTRDGKRVTVSIEPIASSAFRAFDDSTWRILDDVRGYARPTPKPPTPPRPSAAPRAPRPPVLEKFLWSTTGNLLGVTVNGLSDQLKEYFSVKDGVLVTSVTEDSAAAKAGVKAGDVIVSVNGSTIDDPNDLRAQVQSLGANQEFTLSLVRDRKPLTLKGKTAEGRSRRMTTRTIL
jgi:serine protease Do